MSVAIIVQSSRIPNVSYGYELEDIGGDYTAIKIPNLFAYQLMDEFTVTIDGETMSYSVPIYAYRMQESGDENLTILVKALYAYAKAVNDYVKLAN